MDMLNVVALIADWLFIKVGKIVDPKHLQFKYPSEVVFITMVLSPWHRLPIFLLYYLC